MKNLSDIADAVGMCCTVLPDGCVKIDRFAFGAIVEGIREEVREECANRCSALAAIENDSVGYAAQCVREIRALDLK